MKYTTEQAKEKIKEIGFKIHHYSNPQTTELGNLLKEVHDYIRNSDINYMDAYMAVKSISTSQEKFNISMWRVRNTILDRDKL